MATAQSHTTMGTATVAWAMPPTHITRTTMYTAVHRSQTFCLVAMQPQCRGMRQKAATGAMSLT